jgi:hypothetical protein
MSDNAKMGRNREGPPGRRPLVDDELADQRLTAPRPKVPRCSARMGCCPR